MTRPPASHSSHGGQHPRGRSDQFNISTPRVIVQSLVWPKSYSVEQFRLILASLLHSHWMRSNDC